ncbi:MAG: hypothetical protein IKT98_07870, partial [Selenomonadaceae bacterium]|nr:hypothetical protein [Selenomonadaceae bacterium]
KLGSNSITIKGSGDATFTTGDGEIIYSGGVFVNNESVTLPTTFAKDYTLGSAVKNVDSSARSAAIKITGNALDNSIVGGIGADTLDGAAGNDTLTGGNGNDVFVYSGGKDFITDYATTDKIIIADGLTYSDYTINGSDVILNYGTNNSLTIKNGVGKAITTTANKKTEANIYTASGIFDSKQAGVTLASSAGNFNAANYSALVTIDGSKTDAISILGNAKANRIVAGSKGSTLNGGVGNDTLVGGNGVDIFAYAKGDGNDLIQSYGSGDKISLGSGVAITDISTKNNDTTVKLGSNSITIKGSGDATFTTGDGEIIYSGGVFVNNESVTLPTTFAKDYTLGSAVKNVDSSARSAAIKITGNALDNSIVGGTGADTLDGAAGNDTLTGGNGNDIFVYSGGKDVITDYATTDKIIIADGLTYSDYTINDSDVILNYGTNNSLTIKNGVGKAINITANKKTDVNIYMAAGIFDSKQAGVTLASSAGNFNATNYNNLVTIDGSKTNAINIVGNAKANRIVAGSKGSTLNGGVGNDTLIGGNGVDVFAYAKGDGNKVIQNYGSSDKISLGSGVAITDISTKNNDTTVKLGSNSITIKGSGDATFTTGDGEIIYSGGVFVNGESVTLPTTFAKEYTLGAAVKNVDSSARSAAIKITGNALDNSIIGGTGADTLGGAAGNDTLTGGNGNDIFVYSGGKDVITDYATTDKIIIADGLTYSDYTINGSDVILNYGTNNSLTIKNGVGKAITTTANKKTDVNIYTAAGIFDSKQAGVTLASSSGNFNASNYNNLVTIDGSKTDAINIVGNAKANKIVAGSKGSTLNGGVGNDTLVGGNGVDIFAYAKGDGNDLIQSYGSGDKISLGSGVAITDISTKNNDTTVKIGSNSITIKGSGDATFITGGVETIYSGGVFVNGESITLPTTFAKEYTLGAAVKNVDSSARSAVIKITGNALDNSIVGGTGADTLGGVAGNDTLTGGNGNDVFIYSGGKDVITDYATTDKIIIADSLTYSDYTISGSDVILNYGTNNSLTIKNDVGKAITSTANKKTDVNIYTAAGIFDSKQAGVTLASSSGNFNAANYSALVTIDGSKTDAISILGNAKANRIVAGSKGSTLNGGVGNDTLVGGKGADVFAYAKGDGNDLIQNYGSGDKISLGSGAAITDISTKNNDTTVKIGSNSITVKSADDIMFMMDSVETLYSGGVFVNSDTVKVPASFNGTIKLADYGVKNVDGTLGTKAITVQGGTTDDSIVGGSGADKLYGNAGVDTLWGGKGNDTLYGGDGNDKFIFQAGDGSDTIMDYASGELLNILDKTGKAAGTFTQAAYSNNTLTLTVKDGGTLTLKNVGTSTNFNINNETYHVSGKTLAK